MSLNLEDYPGWHHLDVHNTTAGLPNVPYTATAVSPAVDARMPTIPKPESGSNSEPPLPDLLPTDEAAKNPCVCRLPEQGWPPANVKELESLQDKKLQLVIK